MMHRKLFLGLLLLLGLSWTLAAQIPPRPYASYLEYPKYGGTCELGIGQANDPFSQRVELLPAFGVKFSRYVFLGAGAGINYFSSIYDGISNFWMFPIYANVRAFVPTGTSWFVPFVDFKPGYSFGLSPTGVNGVYLSVGAGFAIKMVTLSLGYGHQAAGFKFGKEQNTTAIGGLSFKIGVDL